RKPIVRIVRMNGNSDKMRVMQSVTGVPYMVRCTKVEPLHISFDQLTSTTCHYPHGNEISAMTFCGRLTMAGSSYCLDCHRIAIASQSLRSRHMFGRPRDASSIY